MNLKGAVCVWAFRSQHLQASTIHKVDRNSWCSEEPSCMWFIIRLAAEKLWLHASPCFTYYICIQILFKKYLPFLCSIHRIFVGFHFLQKPLGTCFRRFLAFREGMYLRTRMELLLFLRGFFNFFSRTHLCCLAAFIISSYQVLSHFYINEDSVIKEYFQNKSDKRSDMGN